MTEDDLGDYVKYEDYEKLQQRIAALETDKAKLEKVAEAVLEFETKLFPVLELQLELQSRREPQ